MSRKNLSRTVIEGGRYYANCYLRRASHGIGRARTRDWLDHVTVDVDDADASDPCPPPRVSKQFRDKLGPARRWLDAQVGRPWNKVYSDLRSRFDSRTIAGKHVVDDHLLAMVRHVDEPNRYWAHRMLVIDKHGILRKPALYGRSYRKLRKEVERWAAKRSCTLTHRGWRWVRKQAKGPRCAFGHRCTHAKHYMIDDVVYHAFVFIDAGPMTRGEVKRLDRVAPELRAGLVVSNPWAR